MCNCDFKLRVKLFLTLLIKPGVFLGQCKPGEGSFLPTYLKSFRNYLT